MLSEVFNNPRPILGKIELLPLPGAPGWDGQWDNLVSRAEQEATALASGGVDGLIIENFHDMPYTRGRMDTAGAIAMAMLMRRIKQFTHLPVGLSVLQNDPETALAIAMNTDAAFIRLPLLSGALVTQGGVINSRYNDLLHYKARLRAELPRLLVDISINHLAPAPASHLSLAASNHEPDALRTDGPLEKLIAIAKTIPQEAEPLAVILSDRDLSPDALIAFKDSTGCQVLTENHTGVHAAQAYFELADGLILDAGLRKTTVLQPGLPPSIDMVRVEELVNTLRKVIPVTEMDPDIFLSR